MILAIVCNELIQYRRDGRVLSIGVLMACLLLVSLIAGWSTHAAQKRQLQQAQEQDRQTFQRQGEKAPHSAAHFGRMAYKPTPALALFDTGALPYLGQVIWLEAHRQSPAMFRPAEDSLELRRLADLSVAGILTLLLPLLIALLGCGAFAAERERGTLRQVMSCGVDGGRLFAGKLLALAGVGILVSTVAIAASTVVALCIDEQAAVADTIMRAAGLTLTYGLYGLTFAATTLSVSALSRSSTSAMLTLLSIWAVSIAVVPLVAASVAERTNPTPDSNAFWDGIAQAKRATRPRRDSEELRALELQVLSRALGRAVSMEEARTMDLNRNGLILEIGELLDARVHADAYRDLYDTYRAQQRVRRAFSILSPAIALQHASSALSATDPGAHQHFVLESQGQRNLIIRQMNEDMMLNGAGQGYDYRARAEFWETVPDFHYTPPTAAFGFGSAMLDLVLLAAWSLLVVLVARRIASRLSPLPEGYQS